MASLLYRAHYRQNGLIGVPMGSRLALRDQKKELVHEHGLVIEERVTHTRHCKVDQSRDLCPQAETKKGN